MKRNIFIIMALLITTIISNAQTAKTNEIVYCHGAIDIVLLLAIIFLILSLIVI